jgi:hypothetical protein
MKSSQAGVGEIRFALDAKKPEPKQPAKPAAPPEKVSPAPQRGRQYGVPDRPRQVNKKNNNHLDDCRCRHCRGVR